jgi:hypothetical protein
MLYSSVRAGLLAACVIAGSVAVAACDVNVGNGDFSVGVASGRATDEWTRTYDLAKGGHFELKNINGAIILEPSKEAGKVVVRAERTARSASDEAARELLRKLQIKEEVTADRVRLETVAPRTWGGDSHDVKYVVSIPAGTIVDARTTNGGVQMFRLPNDIQASTVNGGVKGEDLSGHVDASATNGGIEVSLSGMSAGGVRLETTNGGVTLEVPKATNADITARVMNGGVHVSEELSLTVTGEKSRRRLEGRLNSGGSRIDLATTNGGIHIGAR